MRATTNDIPKEPVPPTAFSARPGDVVHVRGTGLAARVIRRCLPLSWGNHDGTLVYVSDTDERGRLPVGWGVAEAEPPRFRVTPWREYWGGLRRGRWQFVFLRPPHVPEDISLSVQQHALMMALFGVRYDRLSLLTHLWNCVTRANLRLNRRWEWYCTEAVAEQYRLAGGERWCPWHCGSLPTPYTTEKRTAEGKLDIVDASHVTGAAVFAEHVEAMRDAEASRAGILPA